MRAKNITYQKVIEMALQVFGYDKDKTLVWWMSPNDQLGNISPYELVKRGKGQRLMRYLSRCAI